MIWPYYILFFLCSWSFLGLIVFNIFEDVVNEDSRYMYNTLVFTLMIMLWPAIALMIFFHICGVFLRFLFRRR
jgi:hypothetical protein